MTVMLDGQVERDNCGPRLSNTLMVTEQVLVLPDTSVAIAVNVCSPREKVDVPTVCRAPAELR